MKEFFTLVLTLLLVLSFSDLDAKCDCKGNEIIYVCQNGETKRVNCSALSDPNVFCGPCNQKPNCTPGAPCNDKNPCTKWDRYDDNCNCYGKLADEDKDGVCDAKDICPDGDDLKDKNKNGMPDDCENRPPPACTECPADNHGKITLCWIPTHKDNMRTVKGKCEYLERFFDESGNLKRDNRCGPCKCEFIGDVDTDGDGVCDRKDECPNNPDKHKPGPCGCDDQDSDQDWVCDADDVCLGHNDKEDADDDGIPDGCDPCPNNPNIKQEPGPCGCDDQDSDGDGVCDNDDCEPTDVKFPAPPKSSCNDGNPYTENDVVTEDGCGCEGTPVVCSIKLVISYIVCNDNGTPAVAADDTYSFAISTEAIEHASAQWEGSYDNAFLGAFHIGPTNYGEKVHVGPFPAGAFSSTNTDPPVIFTNGLSINVHVNDVADKNCSDNAVVDSPGTCACDNADDDEVCDDDDVCEGHDDAEDQDGDGVPDGCDPCPTNPNIKQEPGPCGCNDQDSDGDGVCDNEDCVPYDAQFPATPKEPCDDGDLYTEYDVISEDGCRCEGTPVVCSIKLVISYIVCDDNGTPAVAADDSYSFAISAEAIEHASAQWEGSYDNAFLGAFQIGPTDYGEKVHVGPFPAGAFTSTNTDPPMIFANGLSINVHVNDVAHKDCGDNAVVDSPGTCACDDGDGDEVCDDDDICKGHDDAEDQDGDGVPDGCDDCPANGYKVETGPCGCDDKDSDGDGLCDNDDCAPNDPLLPASSPQYCDDGDPLTEHDVIAAGSCTCIGQEIVCPDTDGDYICNEDDICEGYDDKVDSDYDGTPDGCDECPDNADKTKKGECGCEDCPLDPCDDFCQPKGNSDHEWIDKISMNQLENATGPDGGYGDYRYIILELGHGDSLSLWVFPEHLENICELSIHIYADWNGDCDFEDEDELIFWKRTLAETGTDIAIPYHAIEGDITIRFIVHYGRILSACQECIDGEIEDYTLRIFSRNGYGNSTKDVKEDLLNLSKSALRIFPNPIIENGTFLVEHNLDSSSPLGINIYSLDGNLVSEFDLGAGQLEFSTDFLQAGVYIFELKNDNTIVRETLVVQK